MKFDNKITICSCELKMSVIAVKVCLCLQEQLYKISCHDDARFDHFLQRVWSLLRRYQVRVCLNINTASEIQSNLSKAASQRAEYK